MILQNTVSNVSLLHSRANAYNRSMRKLEIFQEKQHLIRRIAEIQMNSRQAIKTRWNILEKNKTKAAKNYRKNICMENKKISSSIVNALPIISRKQQEKEFKNTIKYSLQITKSKYPTYETMYCSVYIRIKRRLFSKKPTDGIISNKSVEFLSKNSFQKKFLNIESPKLTDEKLLISLYL